MSALARVIRRLATAAATLALVTLAVFFLVAAFPGDAATPDDDNRRLPSEYRAALRAQFHLDDPVPVRYARWLGDLARGDLGTSLREHRPVRAILGERLPVSLLLNGSAILVILLVAGPLGIASAWKPGSAWDRAGAAATTTLYAIPVFWMALVLQWVFSVRLAWVPLFGTAADASSGGALASAVGQARHLVLPVACAAYGGFAYVSRFVRVALVDAAAGDGGRAVRARGASPLRYVAIHGTLQAAVPLLTLAAFLIPRVLGGSLLVEEIFNLPGLGTLLFDSVLARDVPVILALTLMTGAATLVAITAADVLATWADPRIRRGA